MCLGLQGLCSTRWPDYVACNGDDHGCGTTLYEQRTVRATACRLARLVTVHELVTVRVEKLDEHIGVLDDVLMRRVDRALIMFMGLDRV